jgi:hypothetical protein
VTPPLPRPRPELQSALEVATERRRQARLALRRHHDATLIAAREAQTEELGCRAAIERVNAEIDTLLEELARL